MEESVKEEQEKKNVNAVKTFSVPFNLGETKENINITTNTLSKPSHEEIMNQAFKFHSQGNISEAAKYYQYFINQGVNDHRVFSNYGIILNDLGNVKEAELSIRKAIEINPNFAEAHSNLGIILMELGNTDESILNLKKAINIKPDLNEGVTGLGRALLLKNNYVEGLNFLKRGDGTISFDLDNGVSIHH